MHHIQASIPDLTLVSMSRFHEPLSSSLFTKATCRSYSILGIATKAGSKVHAKFAPKSKITIISESPISTKQHWVVNKTSFNRLVNYYLLL
jgi:hypothetical protein